MSSLIPILLIAALIWFWSDSLRARERTLRACATACEQLNVQLLDQTVSLSRLGIRRDAHGRLQMRRIYAFEFSIGGGGRWHGHAVLLGQNVEYVQLDHPDGAIILESPRRNPLDPLH
jgi:hypothetical protein